MNHSLPNRALPSRALQIINEYSQPLTRVNWRHSKPIISQYKLYLYVLNKNKLNYSNTNWEEGLYVRVLYHITDTEWYRAFEYIRFYGLSRYIERMELDGEGHNMLEADGIKDAMYYHTVCYD
uniref:Uncharacterized protein n=1 Tax=viral metagenome TaxID=1070528 RepID=A0A6C0JIB3_9ZZZZ